MPNLAPIACESASKHTVVNIDLGAAVTSTGIDPAVWLAAYTSPRHEKVVARHLAVRDVAYYLPLWKTIRRWKNGCVVPVEFPVFPCYVFIYTSQEKWADLLDIPGLLAFVGIRRRAIPLADGEIDWLRKELPLRRYEPHPYLTVGQKVRIHSGPLAGRSGILVRKKNDIRVVLSVELIQQSVAVEVSTGEIERF